MSHLAVVLACRSLTVDPRQVLENMRRQSADGLALPFLLNWALGMHLNYMVVVHHNISIIGDATNFIGCVLTHQLPFQVCRADCQHHFHPTDPRRADVSCSILLLRRLLPTQPVLLLPLQDPLQTSLSLDTLPHNLRRCRPSAIYRTRGNTLPCTLECSRECRSYCCPPCRAGGTRSSTSAQY